MLIHVEWLDFIILSARYRSNARRAQAKFGNPTEQHQYSGREAIRKDPAGIHFVSCVG